MSKARRPALTITYCTRCNWLLRAGWMAQELLTSFGEELASVTLVPGTGGIFTVAVDGAMLWDRKAEGGFPDAAELKRRLRDAIWPERGLGHVDRARDPGRGALHRPPGGRLPPGPPEDISGQKMNETAADNVLLTFADHDERAVQAGTPMTVTGNGTSPSRRGRGVFIFCPKISAGGKPRRGLGGRQPPRIFAENSIPPVEARHAA